MFLNTAAVHRNTSETHATAVGGLHCALQTWGESQVMIETEKLTTEKNVCTSRPCCGSVSTYSIG